jgi:hypothetical protein
MHTHHQFAPFPPPPLPPSGSWWRGWTWCSRRQHEMHPRPPAPHTHTHTPPPPPVGAGGGAGPPGAAQQRGGAGEGGGAWGWYEHSWQVKACGWRRAPRVRESSTALVASHTRCVNRARAAARGGGGILLCAAAARGAARPPGGLLPPRHKGAARRAGRGRGAHFAVHTASCTARHQRAQLMHISSPPQPENCMIERRTHKLKARADLARALHSLPCAPARGTYRVPIHSYQLGPLKHNPIMTHTYSSPRSSSTLGWPSTWTASRRSAWAREPIV